MLGYASVINSGSYKFCHGSKNNKKSMNFWTKTSLTPLICTFSVDCKQTTGCAKKFYPPEVFGNFSETAENF